MRLLVFGAGGQVGIEVVRAARAAGWEVVALDRRACDVTDAAAVKAAVVKARPKAVVNAAAYTAVDRAEAEPERAFAVNADGAAHVAEAAARASARLVHYSTDYVFDGEKGEPYREGDRPNPLNVYGASKLAGERWTLQLHPGAWVMRTSWVFSAHGSNFVKTMLRLGQEREELAVVADQVGKPTSAQAIAETTLRLLARSDGGLVHFAQPPAVSWHGFAEAIFATARKVGVSLRVRQVRPLPSEAYPTPARRPRNSVLDEGRITRLVGDKPRGWQEDLTNLLTQLHEMAAHGAEW